MGRADERRPQRLNRQWAGGLGTIAGPGWPTAGAGVGSGVTGVGTVPPGSGRAPGAPGAGTAGAGGVGKLQSTTLTGRGAEQPFIKDGKLAEEKK